MTLKDYNKTSTINILFTVLYMSYKTFLSNIFKNVFKMFFTDIPYYRRPETVAIERYFRYFMLNILNLGRELFFILVYKKS